jgi:hypothetical protein
MLVTKQCQSLIQNEAHETKNKVVKSHAHMGQRYLTLWSETEEGGTGMGHAPPPPPPIS